MIYLTTRVGGRGRRRTGDAPGQPSPWWTECVFTALLPGHLAILVWVVGAGGSADEGGWEGVAYSLMAAPVLLVLLTLITVQTMSTTWSVQGPRLTSQQAWLQIGMWASLVAVGAGVTFPSRDRVVTQHSVVLTAFPGAVDLSEAIAWTGLAGFAATFVLLAVSSGTRRAAFVRARRDAARRSRRHIAHSP